MKKSIDLSGQKFGKLTVIKMHHREPKYWKNKVYGYYYFYLCKCDCGNETIASERRLLNGEKKSCGCMHGGRQCKDITGEKFGKLTVIKRVESYKNRYSQWLCKCDCGKEVKVLRSHLLDGTVRSCGCLLLETNTRHGDSRRSGINKLYHIYYGMKARCYNPKNISYRWYGAKGITICDEWLENYQNFKNWANEHGYKEGLSIDRIDSNKNYCPENCRWVTLQENTKNMLETKRQQKITKAEEE